MDVWVFAADFPIETVVLQQEETCDVKWATEKEILDMIEADKFVPMKEHPYYKKLFQMNQ